ncbi:Transcriptional regulatory protein DEP1 [Candida viswanathii]|uniref:Transcriptional regulatory protein DEP1 n=1 Tax=Candida viswanathii TaxID=5486 RepID=A0A367XNF7_9ASCO|nr:Transcriptional regulatory protein DEP1 [Candida viswanathii]
MTQAETEVKNPDAVDNIPLPPPLEKSTALNGDGESDQTSNQVENLTMGKDSPLSDITTSPVPFDLSLREVDGEIQSTIYNIEKLLDEQEEEAKQESQKRDSIERLERAVEEVLKEMENGPESKPELRLALALKKEGERPKQSDGEKQPQQDNNATNNKDDLDNNNVSEDMKNKDSYESSELSDLDENQSEAETDKMDFLDEMDTVHDEERPSNGLSDLQTLSQLTEMARLKDMDSDFGDDEDDDEDTDRPEPVLNGGNVRSPENGASLKRPLEDHSETSSKKSKHMKTENGKKVDAKPVELIELDGDGAEVKHEEGEGEEDDNGAEAEPEDEGDLNDNENEEEGEHDSEQAEKAGDKLKDVEVAAADKEAEVAEDEDEVDINEQRAHAIEELIAIESNFAELRDKLFKDKLSLLERELQLCLEGSHPELSKIYGKINGFYQDGLRLANANLSYKLKCVDKETIATRTSIHQNFMRNLIDTKNLMITDTTSLWYKINKERNQLDQLVPDFNYSAIPAIPNVTVLLEDTLPNGYIESASEPPIPKKLLKQNTLIKLVQQRNSINEQLGILNGLVEFHGFPSAVNSALDEDIPSDIANELLLKRASDEEINEDLRAMGIST